MIFDTEEELLVVWTFYSTCPPDSTCPADVVHRLPRLVPVRSINVTSIELINTPTTDPTPDPTTDGDGMAANYYDSTQARHWTFTKAQLASLRGQLARTHAALHRRHPLPDRRLLHIYLAQQLGRLGRRLGLRAGVVATAHMYVARFYVRVEVRRTNPYLVLATAMYLASKVEECPQHIRLVLAEATRLWPGQLAGCESARVGECEFAMVATLRARLLVHHGFRAVGEVAAAVGAGADETGLAMQVVHDAGVTDLPLLYAPHVIAVTAVFLAVVVRAAGSSAAVAGAAEGPAMSAAMAQRVVLTTGGKGGTTGGGWGRMVEWLAASQVDMEAVVGATQELISLYEVWENYSERACQDGIARFMG